MKNSHVIEAEGGFPSCHLVANLVREVLSVCHSFE